MRRESNEDSSKTENRKVRSKPNSKVRTKQKREQCDADAGLLHTNRQARYTTAHTRAGTHSQHNVGTNTKRHDHKRAQHLTEGTNLQITSHVVCIMYMCSYLRCGGFIGGYICTRGAISGRVLFTQQKSLPYAEVTFAQGLGESVSALILGAHKRGNDHMAIN